MDDKNVDESNGTVNVNKSLRTSFVVLHFVAAISFLLFATYAVFTDTLAIDLITEFVKNYGNYGNELIEFGSKVEFAMKFEAPVALMLDIAVLYVVFCRALYPSGNPLSTGEVHRRSAKNILSDTVEQYLLHIASQLLLITYLDAEWIVKVIPLMCCFFVIGRITFMIGYPSRRLFGFVVTTFPHHFAIGYSMYKFISTVHFAF